MAKYFLGSVGNAEAFRVVNNGANDKKLELAFVSKTLTDSGLNISTTKDDIRAGQGAPIQFSFFHDPSVEITLTDVLWKPEYLEAQLGAQFSKGNGKDYKTLNETVTFAANTKTANYEIADIELLPIPCGTDKYLVWGAPKGSDEYVEIDYNGTTHTLTLPDRVDAPEVATEYCIRYYGKDERAKIAEITSTIIPEELYLLITAPIFAGDACAASKGKAAGHITFEVPRFVLNGAQEFSMNMSSNQTMSLSGTAMAVESQECDAIGGKLLRIIEVIYDRDWKNDIVELVLDEETAKPDTTPVFYAVTKDGNVIDIDNDELDFNPALTNDKFANDDLPVTYTINLKGNEGTTKKYPKVKAETVVIEAE